MSLVVTCTNPECSFISYANYPPRIVCPKCGYKLQDEEPDFIRDDSPFIDDMEEQDYGGLEE